MSESEAELLTRRYEYWDNKRAKHDFIAKMERKLRYKEQNGEHRL